MNLLEQFMWSVVVAIPVGLATIEWALWRLPLGGRLPGDGVLLPYTAVLMWCTWQALVLLDFRGDAELARLMCQASLDLWREPSF